MITPRALKPSQGKILPKSPFQFNITNADKKSPQTPSTKKSQEARMKIKSTLTSLQQDLMPISALDIYTGIFPFSFFFFSIFTL